MASAAWFRPELVLTAGILLLFVMDLGWKRSRRRVLILTLAALACVGTAAACFAPRGHPSGQSWTREFAHDQVVESELLRGIGVRADPRWQHRRIC